MRNLDGEKLKTIRDMKKEIAKLKHDIVSGVKTAEEIDIKKFVDKAKKAISEETIYESAMLSDELISLYGLKIDRLKSKISMETRVVETFSLPLPYVLPSDLSMEKEEEGGEEYGAIAPKGIVIAEGTRDEDFPQFIQYDLEAEKKMLLDLIKREEITIDDWLALSKDKDEYVVRIVAIDELMSSGVIFIDDKNALRIAKREG